MKFYIEITLSCTVKTGINWLWTKVYQQLHMGFATIKNDKGENHIGVSFPEYDSEEHQLGSKLRLFAKDKHSLELFNPKECLNRFLDYVHITQIKEVPDSVTEFALFKRQQVKSSNARLARRKAKRAGISLEQALAVFDVYEEKRVTTLFINMQSQSSDKRFRLFILKQITNQSREGSFNSYGLSQTATVPLF